MMRFAEAEEQYREMEARLIAGELSEDEFFALSAGLRAIDGAGRRWMLNGRTGRWSVYDGRQWVEAEPPVEAEPQADATEIAPSLLPAAEREAGPFGSPAPQPSPMPVSAGAETTMAGARRPGAGQDVPHRARPSALLIVLAALAAMACIAGIAAATWVFFLRDSGEPLPTAPGAIEVSMHQTYTPRPATPTHTPTFTPTPGNNPRPSPTSVPTDTPIPTDTAAPTETPPITPTLTVAAATPTPQPSATPAATGAATRYRVRSGDTMWAIAQRFGLTVQTLALANGLPYNATLHVGQELTIPAAGAAPATPTRAATAQATPTAAKKTATPAPTRGGPTATAKATIAPTARPSTLKGKIAFTVWNPFDNRYDLYVSRIDGSGRNLIGSGFRQPQFRPDGNVLAVNGQGAPDLEHLVTMDAAGNGKVEVSEHTEDSFPAWRADGAIVAFSSASYGDGESRIGLVNDMFGKGWEWVQVNKTEIRGSYPFWLSDGRIVYHGCDFFGGGGACGLYWVGAGGGNYTRLTTHESDTAPAGRSTRVAFMSARDGNWEIYAVNMDGGGLKRLTSNSAADGLPTWSPDGKSIAFVSRRDGAWAIWVMNADGSSQRKLFNLNGGYGSGELDWTNERISWAP